MRRPLIRTLFRPHRRLSRRTCPACPERGDPAPAGAGRGAGGRFKGHAAGVGNVELKGEGRKKQVSLNAPAIHRIGGYEVTHTPGHIGIDLMWHQTRLDFTGQSCVLVYDTVTGEPQAMLIARQRTLQLLFISLSYVSYVPWKTPRLE